MNASPGRSVGRPAASSSRCGPATAGAPARSRGNRAAAAPTGAARATGTARSRIALALAGGGSLGGIYEVGALAALAEALEGVDFNELDLYVGVSAGGFLAASLANGITPARMVRSFIESRGEPGALALKPESLLRPAFAEYAKRAAAVPPLLLASLWGYVTDPLGGNLVESFQRLSRAIPTGVFDNAGIDAYLTALFSTSGRTNDFRKLTCRLFLVATDLDTGESVAFGAPGHDAVPISAAVQASAALPGMFPPVEIDGHHYVDGALKKTLHASIALEEGARLVLCINPLVPFDAGLAERRGAGRRANLIEGGLPVVLSQTFRAIIHSRMQVGMAKYAADYPDADVVLFEPNRDDAEMFFTNVFSYASRKRLAEHAYRKTRTELFRRRHELGPILARHGIRIRLDVLRDTARSLYDHAPPDAPRRRPSRAQEVVRALARTLDDLDRWIERDARPQRIAKLQRAR